MHKLCSFEQQYKRIPSTSNSTDEIHWINEWITPFDAIGIYGFLTLNNPRYYIEVGSGNTTMFAAQAIKDNNLRTKIISIDPHPREHIDKLCYKIYRVPFEEMDLDFFSNLSEEDIFLIDSSHRAFPNSDVTVFFTEILPRLPKRMLYAIHDIYLPADYPEHMSIKRRHWYNEQYLLCAYLLGGANGDKIICPNNYLSSIEDEIIEDLSLWGEHGIFKGIPFKGSFFWIEKA